MTVIKKIKIKITYWYNMRCALWYRGLAIKKMYDDDKRAFLYYIKESDLYLDKCLAIVRHAYEEIREV